MEEQPLEYYEELIRKTMVTAASRIATQVDSAIVTQRLLRAFENKRKGITNVARFFKKEVEEKDRPILKVLGHLSMFGQIFLIYGDDDVGK